MSKWFSLKMSDVKRINEREGYFFFSPNTMRFFNSEIESELYGDTYFITSDRMELKMPKEYTVREFFDDGHISHASRFQEFATKEEAVDFIKEIIRREHNDNYKD